MKPRFWASSAGVTLTELMVAVAIVSIAVLSLVGVFAGIQRIARPKKVAAKTKMGADDSDEDYEYNAADFWLVMVDLSLGRDPTVARIARSPFFRRFDQETRDGCSGSYDEDIGGICKEWRRFFSWDDKCTAFSYRTSNNGPKQTFAVK